MRQQSESALQLATFLEGHPAVERVSYPWLPSHPQHNLAAAQMERPGSLIAFEVADGQAGAFRFLNALRLIRISNNLGDAKSLITHPATTTHKNLTDEARAELGIGGGTLRLSVGLEDADDLIADIDEALARVKKAKIE